MPTRAVPFPQPPRALSRSIVTSSDERVAGAHDPSEAHVFDAAEQGQLVRVPRVGEHRDRARLRERLELYHTGENGIPREMPGEKRFFAGDEILRPNTHTGLEFINAVDEAEGRTVR